MDNLLNQLQTSITHPKKLSLQFSWFANDELGINIRK